MLDFDFSLLKTLKTHKDLDANFTVKLFKQFTDANDYYAKTSSGHTIHKINSHCLFLNAKDDIFAPVDAIDLKQCIILYY